MLNAVVSALFLAFAIYGVVVPALAPLFPSAEVARALRNVACVGPKAAAAGFHEPSLVFMTGTSTLLTDGSGAADFLSQGSCRFALIEKSAERSFAQRAEAIGLRYDVATRIEGYNISQGRPISIAIFRSVTPISILRASTGSPMRARFRSSARRATSSGSISFSSTRTACTSARS